MPVQFYRTVCPECDTEYAPLVRDAACRLATLHCENHEHTSVFADPIDAFA